MHVSDEHTRYLPFYHHVLRHEHFVVPLDTVHDSLLEYDCVQKFVMTIS